MKLAIGIALALGAAWLLVKMTAPSAPAPGQPAPSAAPPAGPTTINGIVGPPSEARSGRGHF